MTADSHANHIPGHPILRALKLYLDMMFVYKLSGKINYVTVSSIPEKDVKDIMEHLGNCVSL